MVRRVLRADGTWTDGPVTVHVGGALDVLRELPAESVHCVVTSPPYWGLRDYGAPGQLGLEPTPEEYVCRMVQVFGEVRRVLRADGTLWLNMGDSYAGNYRGSGGDWEATSTITPSGARRQEAKALNGFSKQVAGLKPKDLVGIPWRLAFALQSDCWWLRADIIWAKPNPMPSSVTDRPGSAHEYVFLLAPSERYFYDAEAVRERSVGGHGSGQHTRAGNRQPGGRSGFGTGIPWEPATSARVKVPGGWVRGPGTHGTIHRDGRTSAEYQEAELQAGRNMRTVWPIATQPYPEAHFATFPEELARRCIAAGTSERGCCPECGAPWRRMTSTAYVKSPVHGSGSVVGRHEASGANGWDGAGLPRVNKAVTTTGWQPTCTHDREPVPCTVLDPFAGSGTTLAVARRMGRRAVGIELQADYLPLIQRRVEEAALPLLDEPPEPEPVAQQVDLEELLTP